MTYSHILVYNDTVTDAQARPLEIRFVQSRPGRCAIACDLAHNLHECGMDSHDVGEDKTARV